MLLNQEKLNHEVPEITEYESNKIYEDLKTYKTPGKLFKNSKHRKEHIYQVYNEIKKKEQEIISKLSGNFLLQAEKYHYDEEGAKIVDQQAVYYSPTTKIHLVDNMKPSIINLTQFLNDVIKSTPNFANWTEFKNYYSN